jgi:hypothetical protein
MKTDIGNNEYGVVTKEDLKEIKENYNKAIAENKISFRFKNNILLVSYAKYLIEFLENQ